MYANKITKSMQKTIDETNYRRKKQNNYNTKYNIVPTPLNKNISNFFISDENSSDQPVKDELITKKIKSLSKKEIEKEIRKYRSKMEKAAKSLDFIEAARFRDIIKELKD